MGRMGFNRTLGGREYDADREWQLRSMRYGEGWDGLMTPPIATMSEQSQLRPTRKMTGVQIRHYQWALRQRPMIQERMVASGSGRTVARSGRINLHLQDVGGQESDTRGISRVQLAIASEASTATNVLGSIHEAEGVAMRAPSDKADRWW